MTSEHVAAIVAGQGGSPALAEQVRGAALDGSQLQRFPMLEQLVDQACGGNSLESPRLLSSEGMPEPLQADARGQSACLAIEYPPGEVHEIDDFEEAAERLVIVLRINCLDAARASTLTRVPMPSRHGDGVTELERMVYDLGHEVMNVASFASDVVHLQVPLRRGRWRSRFVLHRQDDSSESVELQVDFFRLMDASLAVKFPPHDVSLDVLGTSPESWTVAHEQRVFVFYEGVVPFVILDALEPDGIRAKFGPPAFFINMTLFHDSQAQWQYVYSMAYFCASQIQLPQGLGDGLYKVHLELLDHKHELAHALDRFLRVDTSKDFPHHPPPAASEKARRSPWACRAADVGEGCSAFGRAQPATPPCSGHGECVEGWCECWGNFAGEACETDLETAMEYLPEYASGAGGAGGAPPPPAWQCAQVQRFERDLPAIQQQIREAMNPATGLDAAGSRPQPSGSIECRDVVVFAADVSSAFGTTMRALALAVSRAAVVGKPVAMAAGWHFLLHPGCPSGHLRCYFEDLLPCSPDADGASPYVPYFTEPCPNALMPAAACAAAAASRSDAGAAAPDPDMLLQGHDPPVRGRGRGGAGVGGYLDVHGKECADAGRAGVLRLLAPPAQFASPAALPPSRTSAPPQRAKHGPAGEPRAADVDPDPGQTHQGRRGSLWWMALTLDLLLRPNELLRSQLRSARAAAGLRAGAYIGLHVRHGDACGNNGRQCLSADVIAQAVVRMCQRYDEHRVLIATDSPDMVERLQEAAPHVHWHHVPADRSQGSGSALLGQVWPQMLRTRMGLLDRQAVCELSLVDLFLLADAAFLVAQFSSAFSLLALELSVARKGFVPPYIALDGPYWPLVS